MPNSTTYSTSADFTIAAPLSEPFTPGGDQLIEALGRNDPTGFGGDVRRVTVTNSLAMPFGRFFIEMSPRSVIAGKTWGELIKNYSLISIGFRRHGARRGDESVTAESVPLMLGLVDSAEQYEDFSQQAPHRTVRITGRTLSAILADHRYWFHPLVNKDGPEDFRDFYGERPSIKTLRDEFGPRTLGLLAVDPGLFALTDRTPARAMEAAFRLFVEQAGEGPPLIKAMFSDGVPLSKRLRFDAQKAATSHVDRRARLAWAQLPTHMANSNFWQIIEHFAEPPFQELFSEVRGDSVRGAFVEVVARKAPFSGWIGYPTQGASVVFSGQRPLLRGESLFDESYPGWDRYAETVYARDGDNVETQQLSRGLDANLFSMYLALPRIAPMTGNQGQVSWRDLIKPIVDDEPASPSYVQRFGARPLELALKTIEAVDGDDDAIPLGDVRRRCGAYASLAREWFYRMPEMWHGSYKLKGNTAVRAGKRLVDVDRKMEFYITAVTHTIDNERNGNYTTTAQVTRGWPLNEAI